jgi:hypothetical protein
MTTQRSTSAAIRAGLGAAIVRRVRLVVPLVVLSLAIFAASAQAHTVTATATCNSVTFHWTNFASSGGGNGGLNTPEWRITFTPAGVSAATTTARAASTISGQASFAGSSYSLTVAIPGGNGTLTASSSWTSSQTRDGHSGSWSKNLTISDCPPPPVTPPAPPVPPGPRTAPTLSTTASGDVALGEAIHDTALLSGGSSPTGTITFNLYSASDTTCSTVLNSGTVAVNGNGSYDSPAVTPADAGAYQWVATYSGDAGNASAATACNDPAEQSSVGQQIVQASCIRSPVVLRGLAAKVRRSLSVHVTAVGVQSVTFYLDGRRIATVTKPKNQRYSIKVSVRRLGYGRHRLQAKVKTRDANCATAAAAAAFVKVRTPTIRPKFTG